MKSCWLVIFLIAMAFLCGTATARIINVPADYATIQQGINASVNGDTVLVQPGVYYENVNFNGHNIVLSSRYLFTSDTTDICNTIIDGDSSGSVITYNGGEDSSATLMGFTIRNGYAAKGGGIKIIGSSPRIANMHIINNMTFFDGRYGYGAGIYVEDSQAKFDKCLIADNTNEYKGGGAYFCNSNNIELRNCLVIGNSALRGGGVSLVSATCFIYNCTIANNYAERHGGGVYGENAEPFIINSIIWANITDGTGPGYEFFVCQPAISYSNIQGGWEGPGNIEVEPIFRDPTNLDFHLSSLDCNDDFNSPCIDRGHPDMIDSILDCSWGLGTARSDLGAFSGLDSIPHIPRSIDIPANYSSIQNGIIASGNGDTVIVEQGVYDEHLNFWGRRVMVASRFLLEPDSSFLFLTWLEPETDGPIVSFKNGEDSSSVLFGFTLIHGEANAGGGIFCENSGPTIKSNQIYGNSASQGGGVYCNNSNPIIENNIIRSNAGEGIFCNLSNGRIVNNIISSNSRRGIYCDAGELIILGNDISQNAGGLYIFHSNSLIIHNSFTRNAGGGIICASNSCVQIDSNFIDNNSAYDGAGIYISSSVTYSIINNIISFNRATTKGGAIFCGSANTGLVENNIIRNNSASFGGGIYSDSSSINNYPAFSRNHIFENHANYGGGIYANSFSQFNENDIYENTANADGGGVYVASNCLITNNDFHDNYAQNSGGGIWANGTASIRCNNIYQNSASHGGGIGARGSPSIVNNAIYINAADFGGGVSCSGNGSYKNNTIYRNTANVEGGGLYYSDYYDWLEISNTILWHNCADVGNQLNPAESCWIDVSYCDVEGGYNGTGNIKLDPVLIDPENGDFHLKLYSPCIDAGAPWSPLDPDSTRADIGAFYYDHLVGIDDIISQLPKYYSLSQNYPNPFNISTLIKYELPTQAQVSLEIYDILGRRVTTLYSGPQTAGYHQMLWKADDLSSGAYFYKLQADDYTETKKMLLIK